MIETKRILPTGKSSMSILTALVAAVALCCLVGAATLAAPARAVPKAPSGFLGIVPQEGLNRLDTQRMKRGKVKSVRVAVGWDLIQPRSAEKYEWGALDETIRVAAREGVRIMPTLYATPAWMSKRTTNLPVANGNQLDKWRKFVKAAVQRYGSDGEFWEEPHQVQSKLPKTPVREWQIWNEANFHYFATPVSPAKYGRLLDASARVIHNNDPKAEVVVSGLFARPKGSKRQAMDATDFVRKLARYSKKSSVDSLALHPYAKDTSTLKQIMKQFRRAAIDAGFRSKSIQVTEIGWGSGPATNSFLKGSKGAQARQLSSAFEYLIKDRRKLRLKNVYWFAWQDTDPKGVNCSFCYTIGLIEWHKGKKLVAKPAWRKFVKFTRGRP